MGRFSLTFLTAYCYWTELYLDLATLVRRVANLLFPFL